MNMIVTVKLFLTKLYYIKNLTQVSLSNLTLSQVLAYCLSLLIQKVNVA